MIKAESVILALVLVATVSGSGVSPCPVPNHPGTIHTGKTSIIQAESSPPSKVESFQSTKDKTPSATTTACRTLSKGLLRWL